MFLAHKKTEKYSTIEGIIILSIIVPTREKQRTKVWYVLACVTNLE